jgi:hypothetical protein
MLGDSFRRLQADELDAEWDRLVAGGRTTDTSLSNIMHELSARIAPETSGARSRLRQQLFASLARTGVPRDTGISAPLSEPFARTPLPAQAPAKRWWSSPMAALEVLAACLVLMAMTLGVSLYQAGDNSDTTQQLRTASESTPATVPTPSLAYFTESWNNARPAMAAFDIEIGAGKAWMNLSEIHLPTGADYLGDYGGANLFMVVRGTVTVTIGSGTPNVMTAGDAAGIEDAHFSIRNAGTDMAYILHGLIYRDSMIATPSGEAPPAPNYQAYFLGNAVVDLSAGPASVSLEILTEKTINQTVQNDATVLLANQASPITLLVTEGIVGIRGSETTSDDYRTGGGYSPIALGTTTIIGMRGSVALAQPGSIYTLSAPQDSQVMAIALSVEQENP